MTNMTDTPKTAERFAAMGRPVVKVIRDSIYVSSGKKYLCHDYSAIRTQDS